MNYTLKELLDVPKLQELLDALDEVHCLPSAIIDIEGNILTATAWQDICSKFHRVNPDTEKKCIESDLHINASLAEKTPHIIYRCPLGLVDTATPIIIEGNHLGNVFTGQLFMEPPDESYFKEQGRHYGFDEDEYLAAMRKVPLFSEDQLHKNLTFIAKLAQNLAEQGLKSKRLLESEERFDQLAKHSRTFTWEVDVNGLYTFMSHVSEAVIGYLPDEVVGEKHFYDLHPDEGREAFTKSAFEVFEQQDTFQNLTNQIQTKDGNLVWVSTNGFPLVNTDGTFRGYRGSDTDITEMKHAQEKLNELMREQQVILDNSPVGITLMIDRKLVWVNHKMTEILQYSKDELEGQTSQKLYLTQEDYEQLGKEAYPVIAKGQQFETTRELRRRDGSPIWVRYNGRAVAPPDMSKGTVWILEDISEQRSLEAQLRQAQKMEAVGRLAGGVAHDFNNLLTVILGGAYLALMELDPSQPLHDHITSIKRAAEKSADLTQQLLAFARKQTIIPKVLDLNETVENMIKMLQRLIGEDTELKWQPDPDLWPIKADPSQIDQILANLCVNARDSISDIGKITIRTGNSDVDEGYCDEHADITPGEYVNISVCDNGCGMDRDTLAQIFEPFFTTKGVGQGTGLGLATVYGAVRQNNGFINVYSEPGMGTTFTIYLPRYVDDCSDMVRRAPTAAPAPIGSETILLVEDEPSILNMTTMILTKLGYTVLVSNSPAEAIRLAEEQNGDIDLLITDVVMPEMNGKDLANTLQTRYSNFKCLYMSGYTADAIAKHGVLDDGVHFIHKPFSLPALASKVREVLDG
jgi:two-component system cell cycle sensor histidine kinase/response regulator CckA